MKYYLIEIKDNKKGVYKINEKDCVAHSYSLDLALEKFEILKEKAPRGNKCFLVVDFGITKIPLFGYAKRDIRNGYVPFIVIKETGISTSYCQEPKITIVQDGIEQEFNTMEAGIKKFESYLDNKIPAELVLSYQSMGFLEYHSMVCQHRVSITTTVKLLVRKLKYMRKFIID